MDTAMTCSTVATSNKTTIGLDVIEYETSLSNLSSNEFFENFFGLSPTAYLNTMVTVESTPANAAANLHLATTEVVWVEGNTVLNGSTVGCEVAVVGTNTCGAANVGPSIVIINGDLNLSGTPHFYGLVFVRGNFNVGANATFHGAIVVQGETNQTSGSLDITYNSDLLNLSRMAGSLSAPSSAWRDF
jgi:hypothetical protein